MKVIFAGAQSVGTTMLLKIIGSKLVEMKKSVAIVDLKKESDVFYMLASKDASEMDCIPFGEIDFYFKDCKELSDYDYVLYEKELTTEIVQSENCDRLLVVTDLDNKNISIAHHHVDFSWDDNRALIVNKIIDINIREENILKSFNNPESIFHIPFDLKTMAVDMENTHSGTLSTKGFSKHIVKAIDDVLNFIIEDEADLNELNAKKSIFKWRRKA